MQVGFIATLIDRIYRITQNQGRWNHQTKNGNWRHTTQSSVEYIDFTLTFSK
jgi:hypothetical protein